MLVQHLLAGGPIEAFDEGVLVGLSGLDLSERYARELGPLGKHFPMEFAAFVRFQNLRQSVIALELLEHTYQTARVERGIHLDVQHVAVEVIDHIECSESFAPDQRVTHEVHGPGGVGMSGDIQRNPFAVW